MQKGAVDLGIDIDAPRRRRFTALAEGVSINATSRACRHRSGSVARYRRILLFRAHSLALLFAGDIVRYRYLGRWYVELGAIILTRRSITFLLGTAPCLKSYGVPFASSAPFPVRRLSTIPAFSMRNAVRCRA